MAPSMNDQPNELVLTESRTMRAQTADRVDVLDKVKALTLLPDGLHATNEMVASFYEVPVSTLDSLAAANRDELAENGRCVLKGAELKEFATPLGGVANLGVSSKARSLAIYSRRAVLNVGQLLTESDVARRVRTYLLDVEEIATPEQKATAIEKAAEAEAQLRAIEVLSRIDGNTSYARSLSRHIAARMLGEEPELDPADITITCDEYLDGRIAASDMASARTRMGKTVAALYRARYGQDPQKIDRPIHGVHRKVAVYTHRDLDLFDTAWAEVSRHYDVQDRFELGGAA
ncbi:hypothetical protein AB0F09_19330 [Streptomyces olivaceus]|uniref:hypothetical protein n=1 Tax=Streptomyces olivaceus TaxID=47716 RepID=UPI0033DD6949